MSFYAVRNGRQKGVYNTYDEILPLVNGYSGASFRKFSSYDEALKFVNNQNDPPKNNNILKYMTKENKNELPVESVVKPLINHKPLITLKQLVKKVNDKSMPSEPVANLIIRKSDNKDEIKNKLIDISSGSNQIINCLSESINKTTEIINKPNEIIDKPIEIINKPNETIEKSINKPINTKLKPDIKDHMIISSVVPSRPIMDIYCDGSCLGNGSKNASGGIGVWFGSEGHPDNVADPYPEPIVTNQKAELFALITTLKILQNYIEKGDKHDYHIHTDSEYAYNCLGWIPGWIKKNWIKKDGKPVQNVSLLKELYPLYNRHKRRYIVKHVKAHTGGLDKHSLGNARADALANEGATQHVNYKEKQGGQKFYNKNIQFKKSY